MQSSHKDTALLEIIKKYNADYKNINSILREAQCIYGYIPMRVQKIIAAKLWVEIQDVYNEIMKDSDFLLKPNSCNITVCCGNSCIKNGSSKIYDLIFKELDVQDGLSSNEKFFLSKKRCFGVCGKPPVVAIDEDIYKGLKESEIMDVIKKHKYYIDK